MSSIITIGFLDRTRICIQTEFTPPLADDEHRELLIHAALLTGRAFASLSPDRQGALAGVLREWIAARFETCPVQIIGGNPMVCPQRFASTFLAPAREYALATIGCNREAGGIDYFLPMAAAAYLRHVATTDRDPDELLQPALALCAAAVIHPITVANHFQMATASIPKIEPVVDRTELVEPVGDGSPVQQHSKRRFRDTRRSLVVSACLAALVIVLGVQYLSTTVRTPATPQAVPHTLPKQSQEGSEAHGGASLSEGGSPSAPTHEPFRSVGGAPQAAPHPPPKPPSPKARTYLRRVRDIAENSLAQVEVMLAATDRERAMNGELVETLDHGMRQLQDWRQQFVALTPPAVLTSQHQKVGRFMVELGRIAQAIRPQPAGTSAGAIRDRLVLIHEELALVLNDADSF